MNPFSFYRPTWQKCHLTSLVGQWLGLPASAAGSVGLIPGWGTKIPHAAQQKQTKQKNTKMPLANYCCPSTVLKPPHAPLCPLLFTGSSCFPVPLYFLSWGEQTFSIESQIVNRSSLAGHGSLNYSVLLLWQENSHKHKRCPGLCSHRNRRWGP